MIKRNKWKLLISSLVILLPMLLGIFGDRILPETITVHWGIDGSADGWMNSSTFFLIFPVILLAIHWLCMIVTAVIDKNAAQNAKTMGIMLAIIPVISLTANAMIIMSALGHTTKAYAIICLLLGVLFIVIGNYMPKMTRSRTMGLKFKWTLSNDENWNATHRFAGKVTVIAGFLSLLAMPLPTVAFPFVAIALILAITVIPTVYSYRFYKKQVAEGKVTPEDYKREYEKFVKNPKAARIVGICTTVVLLITLVPLMFAGKLEATVGDDALTVKASGWTNLTLPYEEIEKIEYRESSVDGNRMIGYASAKLLLGTFQNEEFGTYTRYTYTKNTPCVVLTTDKGTVIVIGLKDEAQTKAFYDQLVAKVAQ